MELRDKKKALEKGENAANRVKFFPSGLGVRSVGLLFSVRKGQNYCNVEKSL